jgi:hypothetical protein
MTIDEILADEYPRIAKRFTFSETPSGEIRTRHAGRDLSPLTALALDVKGIFFSETFFGAFKAGLILGLGTKNTRMLIGAEMLENHSLREPLRKALRIGKPPKKT